MTNEIIKVKNDLITELDKRIEDKIIEKTNADLLKKLITNAETINEAIMIAELGTTYKRTGFHFDKRLEKMTGTIKYFKKNKKLSFAHDKNALTHKLIIGDNYDALLNLLIEFRGKIDVIYIDPPYGKDDMGEFAKTNYENAITRDNLLSMLYPRLVLARQLLSDNGVIFCSIDDKNQAYVKGLFDEVFGDGNAETIIWHKVDDDSGRLKITRRVRKEHEYILVAYKNIEEVYFKKYLSDRNYKNSYTNPDNDPRGEYKQGIISTTEANSKEKGKNYYSVTTPSGKVFTRQWRVTKEEFDELNHDNRIYYGKKGDSVPSLKVFINEQKETTPTTIFSGLGTAKSAGQDLMKIFGGKRLFDYPKPVDLIEHLLKIATNESSIILDFFAGSGTTGQAVLDLNKKDSGRRKYILIQLDEDLDKALKENPNSETIKNQIAFCNELGRQHKLSEITAERLNRVMNGEIYKLGDNLDVYDIATVANFEATENKTPFDVIDETLYGKEKLGVKEKIKWVCENFESMQKKLEDK
jgi:adenine-specific DNA-methyltransferase